MSNLKDYHFNQFGLEYSNGYVVTALGVKVDGFRKWFPIRNFGPHQGDARIFKECDVCNLTQNDIIMLANNYNPNRVYRRINAHRFVLENKSCSHCKS